MKLLTSSNIKLQKGEKQGYKSYILHLAPYTLGGINVCPKATAGCIAGCLNTAGHGGMFKAGETTNTVQEARIRRTRFFASDRAGFMDTLISDVTKAIKQAERKGMIPVFRLNGTSDLSWEKYLVDGKNIFEHFPNIQFYDYTKVLGRKVKHIPNYHLTFSRSEDNDADVMKALEQGNTELTTTIGIQKQALRDVTNIETGSIVTLSDLKSTWDTELLGESPYK